MAGTASEIPDLNDLATAPDVLKKLGVADDPGAADLLAHGKKGKLLDAAVDAHDDFIDTKRFW